MWEQLSPKCEEQSGEGSSEAEPKLEALEGFNGKESRFSLLGCWRSLWSVIYTSV